MQIVEKFDNISDWFWIIVEEVRGGRDKLESILMQMTKEELLRFAFEFDNAALFFRDTEYVSQMGTVSEDTVEDISNWIVSRNKDYALDILANPHKISEIDAIDFTHDVSPVAGIVFLKRFNELPDRLSE